MTTLFVLNEGPRGNERSYNALRWALALVEQAGEAVRVFLMNDAVACAVRGRETPAGFSNVERLVSS